MRPVNKGGAPFIAFKYSEYQSDLFNKIGGYCSYCEMPLPHDVEIEHKLPKRQYPVYKHKWKNLLLSCKNCNTHKGESSNYKNCYWSDINNPFYYLDFSDGIVKIKNGLNGRQQAKIQNTISLVGLDLKPQNNIKDQRWRRRKEAFETANLALKLLNTYADSKVVVDNIIHNAKHTGFWSIWMTVFTNHINIKQRLINEFAGTCQTCFDSNLQPRERP